MQSCDAFTQEVCSKCQGYVYCFVQDSCVWNKCCWVRRTGGFGFGLFSAADCGWYCCPQNLVKSELALFCPGIHSTWSIPLVVGLAVGCGHIQALGNTMWAGAPSCAMSDNCNGLQKVTVLHFSCAFQRTRVLGGFKCYETIRNCGVWPNAEAVHTILSQLQLQLLHGLEVLLQGSFRLERILWGI